MPSLCSRLLLLALLPELGQSRGMRVAIIGAGPVGLFLAARLLDMNPSPGLEVDIYEASSDPRLAPSERSFAIGLSRRTMVALEAVPDLAEHIIRQATEAIEQTTFRNGWGKSRVVPHPVEAKRLRMSTQVHPSHLTPIP